MNSFTTSFTKLDPRSHGLFISFEGIDGCGKSTQIKRLEKNLINLGYNPIVFREPGGTKFGEKLRDSILTSDKKLSPLAEAHLFCSSRAQLLYEEILPLLSRSRKNIVILDRYLYSSMAYQGEGRGLGQECIANLHSNHPLNITPHLTFYLKISAETSLKRQDVRNSKKDYFEQEQNDFYIKLINGYEKAFNLFGHGVKEISGEKDLNTIEKEILGYTKEVLKSHE
ncbi:MAG: dTMP kinase [Halobacteriovoraceae bacterium]|nr:dTMP kinase [Halobacteriovoraceae bacterium]